MSYSRDSIRNALLELVARRDPTVFQDAEVFEHQLQLIGKWPALPEISALKAGLRERFPWELQKDPSRVVSARVAENLAAVLQKKHAVESSIALWAVESWGLSLGLKVQLPPATKAADPEKTGSFTAPTAPANPTAHATPSTPATPAQKPSPQEPPPAPVASVAPPPPANTPAKPAFTEPDTSSTRLGVIFGSDEAGLIRVYKSWFDNAPEKESAPMLATTVKIQPAKAVPLFSAAPKTRKKKTERATSPAQPSNQPDANAPRMVKQTLENKPTTAEKAQPNQAPTPPVTDNAADSLLARANALLPGGSGRLDVREALGLLQLAVKKGSIKARRRFGEIYLKGIGVNPNLPNAASWFKTAAELGDAEAQFQLGSLYACGVGVQYSAELAQDWLQKAINQGHKGAEDLLKQILQA